MKLKKNMFNKLTKIHVAGLCAAAFCMLLTATVLLMTSEPAHAVRVSLKRIVFDGSKRSEILTLINNTAEPKTYRLGWRKYRMDETMSLRSIEEDDDASDILWADEMIRYAPRRVTIQPGGTQQVRLLLRRPKDIQEAEYRAHLWIITETEPESFSPDPGSKKQSIRLAVQPAISLPVFVRHGNLSVKSSITNPVLTKTAEGYDIAFTLNREGNRSIYGDFDFICKDGGQDTVLRKIRGLAVYPETDYRNLKFEIPTATSCSTVQIVYRSDPNDRDFAGAVLSEATATLQ